MTLSPDLPILLNYLAGTTGKDVPVAANIWAGTSGLDTIDALNRKAGTTGLDMNAVCCRLAGVSPNNDAVFALSALAAGTVVSPTSHLILEQGGRLILEGGTSLLLLES